MVVSLSTLTALLGLAALQGALVALPRGDALRRLGRLRSPAWAALLPALIAVGTLGLGMVRSAGGDLMVLAALATPLLATVAALAVVRRPLAWAACLALAAVGAGLLYRGWVGQLSASALTALGCLTVGAALVRVVPARWALAGVACMCALDAVLLPTGLGQASTHAMTAANAHFHGPRFDRASLGPITTDYPDLLLAAVIGAFLAGKPYQRRAAALVLCLVFSYGLLLKVIDPLPATLPLALAFLLARFGPRPALRRHPPFSGIPRRQPTPSGPPVRTRAWA